MSIKNIFRLLVGASLMLVLAGIIVAAYPGNISEDWKTILEWSGDGGVMMQLGSSLMDMPGRTLYIGLLVGFIGFIFAVQIGLFMFWRFARVSYLVLTLLFCLFTVFDGLMVFVPMELAIYQLSLLCDGAIITMAYMSPIKEYFEASNMSGRTDVAAQAPINMDVQHHES